MENYATDKFKIDFQPIGKLSIILVHLYTNLTEVLKENKEIGPL